jgi:hypothetical protein
VALRRYQQLDDLLGPIKRHVLAIAEGWERQIDLELQRMREEH